MPSRESRVESREPNSRGDSPIFNLLFATCSLQSNWFLAFAICVSLIVASASAGELQWRTAGPKKFTPSADSQPINSKSGATAASKAKMAFAKPAPRKDGAVRAVGFEDDGRREFEGPAFATQASGSTSDPSNGPGLRSVVVDGNHVEGDHSHSQEDGESVRSAQLQFQPPAENRYEEQINEPFGQPPAVESMESESTEVELNEEEITLPPNGSDTAAPTDTAPLDTAPIERQPGATGRPPRSFQPAPPRNAPRPDPFVEADENPGAGLPNTEDPTLSDEGIDSEADCTRELQKLKSHTLDQVNLSIAIAGDPGQDFPYECTIDEGAWHEGRCWTETTYMWKASALCHKPLYFEDEALERYGHSWGPCLDPVVSGAHFFAKLPVLPYCMGVHPPNECMYALGHYRPGNCAPYMIPPVPLSARGAVLEAGAVVGAAAILP
jgi:hypothetical protein